MSELYKAAKRILKELWRSEEMIGTCKVVENVLKKLGYDVNTVYFSGGCSIDFKNPEAHRKLVELLEKAGMSREHAEMRSSWSSKGTVRVEDLGDKIEIEADCPVVIFPNGFRTCEVPYFPKKEIYIDAVHVHGDVGHGSVHIHLSGEIIKRNFARQLSKFRKEFRSFILKCGKCQEKMYKR